jgi:hypothetical protein
MDLSALDIRRFGKFHGNRKFLQERRLKFEMREMIRNCEQKFKLT